MTRLTTTDDDRLDTHHQLVAYNPNEFNNKRLHRRFSIGPFYRDNQIVLLVVEK